MKHVGLVFLGTSKYADFFPFWYHGVTNFLFEGCKKTIFAASDRIQEDMFNKPNVVGAHLEHQPWPYITLNRFTYICQFLQVMEDSGVEYVLFLDADLFAQQKITFDEVFDPDLPLVGVLHPGKIDNPDWHSFVTEGESRSNVVKYADADITTIKEKAYRQGCLWGGTLEEVTKMCRGLSEAIEEDYSKGIIADWHDESHMNCWFLANEDKVKTLPSSFAFPDQAHWYRVLGEAGLSPMMLHIDKPMSEYPRFKGGSSSLDKTKQEENFRQWNKLGLWPLVCGGCGLKGPSKIEDLDQLTMSSWHVANDSSGEIFPLCEKCAHSVRGGDE